MAAYTSYTIPGKGDLKFYWIDQEIWADSTTLSVTAQELIDAIRTVEDTPCGLLYPSIANAAGKDDLGGDVATAITLTLLDNWVIYSERGSGFFTVKDGNIIRHDATTPFKSNINITYQQVLFQGGVITTVNAGSGLSTDEHNQLMSLSPASETAEQVWNTGTSAVSWSASSFATRVLNLLTRNQFISGS
jgi:hypothetical protein